MAGATIAPQRIGTRRTQGSGRVMIDFLDSIGDFIEGRPWVALGWALLCLLVLSSVISLAQRRIIRKLAIEAKTRDEQNLRVRDA
jgi:hypothetical protein